MEQFLLNDTNLPKIILSDDQYLQLINDNLKKYNLSLYFDDIKEWDDPDKVEEKCLEELQFAIWNLFRDKISEEYIDYTKFKIIGGYKLNQVKNIIEINCQYGESKIKKIKLFVWQATRLETTLKINEKISSAIKKSVYFENNWKSIGFIENLATQCRIQFLKSLNKKIKIKDEEVLINEYRIVFESWDISNKVTLRYQYILDKQPLVISLKLQSKVNISKIIPTIIKSLQEIHGLNFTIKNFNWKDNKAFWEKFDFIKTKFQNALKIISKLPNIPESILEILNLPVVIDKTSPIGPFENNAKIYFRINNSKALIPVTINFQNSITNDHIYELKNYFNLILLKYCFKLSFLETTSDDEILNVIKKIITNKIIFEGESVPFDNEKLVIKDRQKLVRIKNNTFFTFNLFLQNNLIPIPIQIKAI